MRPTPCASCGDRRLAIALQAGRVVLCDPCTRAIAGWFFAADEQELEAFFGYAIPRAMRRARLLSETSATDTAHRDLARGYASRGLRADASTEWALAASKSDEPHEAMARLLEPIIARGTLEALSRSLGLYLVNRRVTAS